VVRRRLAWLAWIALIFAVVSGVAWLFLVAQSITDQALAEVFSQGVLWTVVSKTDFGRDWLVRLALACVLGALFIPFLSAKRTPPAWVNAITALAAAAFVGTLAWAGHAVGGSGIEGSLHPAADVLHLIAAAGWVGALLPLALLLGAAGRHAGSLATVRTATIRFSALGLVTVGALLVTGTVNTWYLAGSISALTETDYGRLLLLKIALFFGMVAIAVVNRLRLTPRLVASTSEGPARDVLRQLRRNVVIEIAAGAAILAVVAILGVTPPGIDEGITPHAHHHTH